MAPWPPRPRKQHTLPPVFSIDHLEHLPYLSNLDRLHVNASATFLAPAPASARLTVPSLPLIISLPPHPNDTFSDHTSPVVRVETDPLTLTHPNVTVHIHGHVAALITCDSFPSLSSFVTSYLDGQSPGISLSTPLVPDVTVHTTFPAPDPNLQFKHHPPSEKTRSTQPME